MLTGDNMSGTRAAELGFANESVPEAELDAKVLDVAQRVAIVSQHRSAQPPSCQKGSSFPGWLLIPMWTTGPVGPSNDQQARRPSPNGSDGYPQRPSRWYGAPALATYTRTTRDWMSEIAKGGLSSALSKRTRSSVIIGPRKAGTMRANRRPTFSMQMAGMVWIAKEFQTIVFVDWQTIAITPPAQRTPAAAAACASRSGSPQSARASAPCSACSRNTLPVAAPASLAILSAAIGACRRAA